MSGVRHPRASRRLSAAAAFALVLLAFAAIPAVAQVQYSIGNSFRYGNGTQVVGGVDQHKEYIEEQFNGRLFWDAFTIGFEYIYDNPPEFGPTYIGMRKRYVEFAKEGLELRAGDSYSLYGKGLAINLFEDRGINYDTKMDGIKGLYRNSLGQGIFAMGQVKYYDLLNANRIEVYDVTSGNLQIIPYEGVRVGGSMIGARGALPTSFGTDQVYMEMPEAMLELQLEGLQVFGQGAWKFDDIASPQAGGAVRSYTSYGTALYGALSWTGTPGFGATLDYKDYRYDVVNEEDRDPNRPSRMLPIANPPIVRKEHSFTLLSRNPHVVDFNDEIGWQLDLFWAVTPRLTLSANGSQSSRHYGYVTENGVRTTYGLEASMLPTTDEKFSPYWEGYVEAEWYFEETSFVRAAFDMREETQYEAGLGHTTSSINLPVRIEYMLTDVYGLGVSLEQQFYHDSFLAKPDYFNEFVSLTLSRAGGWSATARTEFTTDEADPSGKKFWLAGEVSYRLEQAHIATLMVGSERGGLICSNGICRQVLPFNGVRLSIISQI